MGEGEARQSGDAEHEPHEPCGWEVTRQWPGIIEQRADGHVHDHDERETDPGRSARAALLRARAALGAGPAHRSRELPPGREAGLGQEAFGMGVRRLSPVRAGPRSGVGGVADREVGGLGLGERFDVLGLRLAADLRA